MTHRLSLLIASLVLTIPSAFTHAAPMPAASQPLEILAPGSEGANAQATYSYNFGSWRVGSTAYADLAFANRGRSPIYIRQIYTYGNSFRTVNNCPRALTRGYQCMIRIFFRPWTYGTQTGQVVINTNGEDTRIHLTGHGY